MSYRRFKFPEIECSPATLATTATLPAAPGPTVANVASVAGGVSQTTILESLPEPDEVELEERKAMATGNVPEVYLDGWVRLQLQRLVHIPKAQWRLAIDDAGRYLDEWGALAAEFGWTSSAIFDVPGDGKRPGLVWWLSGETATALGPAHAAAGERVFDRETRNEWQNPYQRQARP